MHVARYRLRCRRQFSGSPSDVMPSFFVLPTHSREPGVCAPEVRGPSSPIVPAPVVVRSFLGRVLEGRLQGLDRAWFLRNSG